LIVQPFKVGPDYIDPSYHTRAAGRPSRNLDTWMVPRASLAELYKRAIDGVDFALIEGVMGLFDGRGGDEEGSTAHLAKLLGVPVVVVVDVEKVSRTAGAIALGCQWFDPTVDVAGFILNGVAGDNHRRWVGEAIEGATGLPVLGWLPRRDDLGLPERHLGLIPTDESRIGEEFFDRLADQVEESIDLDRVLALPSSRSDENRGKALPPQAISSTLFPAAPLPLEVAIGIAQDEAFNFYYPDNLDLLQAWGARLVPFSPLHDQTLPEGLAALYLGGGFPELFAKDLAANQSLHAAIRRVAAAGTPIYAECGGMMYLSEGIADVTGERHRMVGLVPAWSAMTKKQLTLGYRELRARVDTPILGRGEIARGHEFHWSELEASLPFDHAAYDVLAAPVPHEGFARRNFLASYCHLHFGSNPRLARNFVQAAASWQGRTQ
jgi:cobyrinic acid a,c-diamide synthase